MQLKVLVLLFAPFLETGGKLQTSFSVRGLIGSGKVTMTMEESEPYWPDERSMGTVKYPYRIRFTPTRIIEEEEWKSKSVSIRHLGPIYFGGINPIRSKYLLARLRELMNKIR